MRIDANSVIGGTTNVTLYSTVEIGEIGIGGATLGGLSVNDSGAGFELNVSVNTGSLINGNVSVTGTSQFNVSGDTFAVDGGATITGSVTANLGDNANNWLLGGTFDGPVTLIGGTGSIPPPINLIILNDSFSGTGTSGTFLSSFTANMTGSTEILFPSAAFSGNNAATIAGNMTLSFGNGDNTLGNGTPGSFGGTVGGNLSVTLGNGTNSALISNAPGGKLIWNSGTGTDALTLGPSDPSTSYVWNVNLRFGNGSNSLTLATDIVPQSIIGTVIGGSGGSNTFSEDPTTWSIVSPFTISNF